jgi:hypothetical protein
LEEGENGLEEYGESDGERELSVVEDNGKVKDKGLRE